MLLFRSSWIVQALAALPLDVRKAYGFPLLVPFNSPRLRLQRPRRSLGKKNEKKADRKGKAFPHFKRLSRKERNHGLRLAELPASRLCSLSTAQLPSDW